MFYMEVTMQIRI